MFGTITLNERADWHSGSATLIEVSGNLSLLHRNNRQNVVRSRQVPAIRSVAHPSRQRSQPSVDAFEEPWEETVRGEKPRGDDHRGTGKAPRTGPARRRREAHCGAARQGPPDGPRAAVGAARSRQLRRI